MAVNPSVRCEPPPYEFSDKESPDLPKTMEDIAIVLGFVPELDGQTCLLKVLHDMAAGLGGSKVLEAFSPTG